MNTISLTICDGVGLCGECGQRPEHLYQMCLAGHAILLCGRCLETFVIQVQWLRHLAEPNLKADQPSELRCMRCLDRLAAYVTTYYRRR